jgi:hypothetical protein
MAGPGQKEHLFFLYPQSTHGQLNFGVPARLP